jgi:hypothetical protein
VSGGGYTPGQQDCPLNGESTAQPNGTTVPGCHTFKLNVEDGNGVRYGELGIDQLPNGYPSTPGLLGVGYPGSPNFPHSGCLAVNTNGTGGGVGNECGNNSGGLGLRIIFDTEDTTRNAVTPSNGTPDAQALAAGVAKGLLVYLGADDNLDAGEHDGVSLLNGTDTSVNGPSDGGAVQLSTTPGAAGTTPSLIDPLPILSAAFGACADGICFDTGTRRQTLYNGNPDTNDSRDVANYDGKQWDPYTCSSGSQNDERQCHDANHTDMNDYRNGEKHSVNAEPGVQVFEDPDAQSSPIDPIYEGGGSPTPLLYPLPGIYVGTCGLILGGGPLFGTAAPPGTVPMTNSANQLVVPTGC